MRHRLFVFALLLLTASARAQEEPYLLLGPMLGHTDDRAARVWARASGAAELDIAIGEQPDLSDARIANGPSLKGDSAFTGVVAIQDLKPDTQYHYAVMLNGKRVTPRPYPAFRTAGPAGQAGPLRVAFSSCNGHHGALAAAAFAQLHAGGRADLMLQLGDNHYGDTTDPQKLRAHYLDHRSVPSFRAASASIPFYGIWDDHDYGPNNSDGGAEGKEDSLRVFTEHWANPAYGEADHPGIYFSFARAGVRFIALDCRYHRDPNKAPASPQKTMLGKHQKAWLKAQLLNAKEKIKLVLCGSEFQLNGHVDSWTSFRDEQAELLNFVNDHKIEGVMLLTGDRHFTAAYQVGGRLIEITAGPMGSKNFPTKVLPDMFMLQNEGKLFAVLDLDAAQDPPKVVLEFHRAGDGLVQQRELTWDEINGRKRIEPLAP